MPVLLKMILYDSLTSHQSIDQSIIWHDLSARAAPPPTQIGCVHQLTWCDSAGTDIGRVLPNTDIVPSCHRYEVPSIGGQVSDSIR